MENELSPAYRKPIYFNEEEKDSVLRDFQEFIKKDWRVTEKLKKGNTKRFSVAIKMLMEMYNNSVKAKGYPKKPEKDNKDPKQNKNAIS